MSKKQSQPPSQKTRPSESEIVAAVDNTVEAIRHFLLLLAQLTGALPQEPKS